MMAPPDRIGEIDHQGSMMVGIPSSETSVNGTKRGVKVHIAYDLMEIAL
jgi:hypothetical protein